MTEDYKIRQGRPRKEVDLKRVMQMHRDGETISYIADALGVSRTTIWKRIQAIKKEVRDGIPV